MKKQMETYELAGMDDYDIARVQGDGFDESDVTKWPKEIVDAARSNWTGGPEAFDRWFREQARAVAPK